MTYTPKPTREDQAADRGSSIGVLIAEQKMKLVQELRVLAKDLAAELNAGGGFGGQPTVFTLQRAASVIESSVAKDYPDLVQALSDAQATR